MGRRKNTRDLSAEILFQSLVREANVSSSGLDKDVHSLTLSFQHLLCQPRRCPHSKVPWKIVLERLSWRMACLNHESFRLLPVARRGSCGPTRESIFLHTSVVGLSTFTESSKCISPVQFLELFIQLLDCSWNNFWPSYYGLDSFIFLLNRKPCFCLRLFTTIY